MNQPPAPVPQAQPFPLEIRTHTVRTGVRLSLDSGVRCLPLPELLRLRCPHGRHARAFLTWCQPPCFPQGPCHLLQLNYCCTEASRLTAVSAWAPVPWHTGNPTQPNLCSVTPGCVTYRGKPNIPGWKLGDTAAPPPPQADWRKRFNYHRRPSVWYTVSATKTIKEVLRKGCPRWAEALSQDFQLPTGSSPKGSLLGRGGRHCLGQQPGQTPPVPAEAQEPDWGEGS